MEEENIQQQACQNFIRRHMREIIGFIGERYDGYWSALPAEEAVEKFEFDVPMFVYRLMTGRECEMPKFMANMVINMPGEHLEILMEDKTKSEAFDDLVQLLYFRTISEQTYRDVFKLMVEGGIDLSNGKIGEYLYGNDLFASGFDIVEETARRVEAEFQRQYQEFKAGNRKILNFLVGQCMKKSKGKASAGDFIEFFEKDV